VPYVSELPDLNASSLDPVRLPATFSTPGSLIDTAFAMTGFLNMPNQPKTPSDNPE
jgi:hypothetical protein